MGGTNAVAVAAERAGPDRLLHVSGAEAGLQRAVPALRSHRLEAGLLVGRAADHAEPAADAAPVVQKTASGLRMKAGSAASFIARWRATISLPNMRGR